MRGSFLFIIMLASTGIAGTPDAKSKAALPSETATRAPTEKSTTARTARGLVTPRPPYPVRALQNNMQGRMNLRVHFNEKGGVEKVAVLESSCPRFLTDYTVAWATKNWRLEPLPGFKGGYRDIPMVYQLGPSR